MSPISVIIPAYNEADGISKVVEHVKSFMTEGKIEHEIIVVNDCSTDNTANEAGRLGVTVISHPINRGYGASLITGLKKAKYDHVLIIDADESYPVEETKKLLPYINDFDMVVGARQGKYYHGSLVKRISRGIFYILLGYVTGEKVPDANSGMRIFRKSVVMQFEDDFCTGFSFTTTITIILLSNRFLIKFVPIEYRKRTGRSKVRHLSDTARTVQILLHAVVHHNPIKAFLPFSAISFLLAVLFLVLSAFKTNTTLYALSALISFISSMGFMGLGMLSYAVVKGSRRR